MSVNAYWFSEDERIIRFDFFGDWTWQEFYLAFEQSQQMRAAVSGRVDTIIDMSSSGRLPNNVLSHLVRVTSRVSKNPGLAVVVSSDRFILALYQASTRMYRQVAKRFRIAPTVAESLVTIHAERGGGRDARRSTMEMFTISRANGD